MKDLLSTKGVLLVALAFGAVGSRIEKLRAQMPTCDPAESMEARGTIGSYPIGLNYTVCRNTEFVAAHYFYVSQLKNIALTGPVSGESVELEATDGSMFRLHFVGNGSNGNQPLTFYNSIGLDGSWSLHGRDLPVKLQFEHSTNKSRATVVLASHFSVRCCLRVYGEIRQRGESERRSECRFEVHSLPFTRECRASLSFDTKPNGTSEALVTDLH